MNLYLRILLKIIIISQNVKSYSFLKLNFLREYHPATIGRIPIGKIAMPEARDKKEPNFVLFFNRKIPPVIDIIPDNKFIAPIRGFIVEQ